MIVCQWLSYDQAIKKNLWISHKDGSSCGTRRQAGCALLHLKLLLLFRALSSSTHLETAWELLLVSAIANSLHAHTCIKSSFSNNSLHLSHPQELIAFIASAALNCYPPPFILYLYHCPRCLPCSYLNPCPVSNPRIAAPTCHEPFIRISVFLAVPIFYFMFLRLQRVFTGNSYTQVQQENKLLP